jgi:hypothetical protein
MMYPAYQTVDFYEGTFRLPTELHPAYWHPRAREVVLVAEIPDSSLEYLISEAEEWGWQYNPYTRTFTRR